MDDQRLERLVGEHGPALFGFLAYRTDADTAEDLLADVFERAVRARRRYDPRRASERTWLLTIALNVWRDHERRRGTEARGLPRLAAEQLPHGADFADAVLERDRLHTALRDLPADEREALALVYGADLKQDAAARVLDVPLTTLQGRIYRGLRNLRATLEEVE